MNSPHQFVTMQLEHVAPQHYTAQRFKSTVDYVWGHVCFSFMVLIFDWLALRIAQMM